MHPVLGGLPDEILLTTAGGAVAAGGIAPRPDEVVQLGELDDEGVIVLLEEGLCPQPRRKDGLQMPGGLFLRWGLPVSRGLSDGRDGDDSGGLRHAS